MSDPAFDRAMAAIRGTCVDVLFDAKGAIRFSLEKDGIPKLTKVHADTFVSEMRPKYEVTYQEADDMFHFTVSSS